MYFEECDVDDLWISIKLENNKSLILVNMYRHQSYTSKTFKENFVNVLDILNEKKKYFIIGSDVNINLFNRDQHICDYLNCISSPCAKQFVDLLMILSYDCSSSSLIDHFYSSFWEIR